MARGIGTWLAVGCLGVTALGCAGIVATGGVLFYTMKQSDAYRASEAFAVAHPVVLAETGPAPQVSWFPVGSIEASGSAEFTHTLTGPDGKAVVHTDLERTDGSWSVVRASIEEDGRPRLLSTEPRAPTPEQADPGRVAALMVEARAAYEAGQDAAAIVACDEALAMDPSQVNAYYWRGRANVRRNELERAIADFEAATERAPDHAEAWEGLAWAFARSGLDDDAVDALDHLVKLQPKNTKAFVDRANARFRLGDQDEALADAAAACGLGYEPGCELQRRMKR